MGRPIRYIGRWLPRGWGDLLLQFGLFFVAYQGYGLVRGLVDQKADLAIANGQHVIDLERSLGTYFELDLQNAALPHDWIIETANFLYLNSHFTITITFLAWLYLFRNDSFYFVRNMFMVAMGIALIGYGLLPTAPPRLMPDAGFTDTIESFTGVAQDSETTGAFINKYAAVPSMHIGFSSMIAGTAFSLVRNPIGRYMWLLYPVVVFFVIVLTANHYWIDGAAGLAVAIAAALIASRVLAPMRPANWSFRPERSKTAEATA